MATSTPKPDALTSAASVIASALAAARALADAKGRVKLGTLYLTATPDDVFDFEDSGMTVEEALSDLLTRQSNKAAREVVAHFGRVDKAKAGEVMHAVGLSKARDAAFAVLLTCAPSSYDRMVEAAVEAAATATPEEAEEVEAELGGDDEDPDAPAPNG